MSACNFDNEKIKGEVDLDFSELYTTMLGDGQSRLVYSFIGRIYRATQGTSWFLLIYPDVAQLPVGTILSYYCCVPMAPW